MKDKLEKTGHKKLYYRLKSVLTIFMFSIALAAAAAIPVGISYRLSAEKAEEESATSYVAPTASEAGSSSSN